MCVCVYVCVCAFIDFIAISSSGHGNVLFKIFLNSSKFRSLTQITDFISNRNINQLMLLYFDKCHVKYNSLYFNLIFTSRHVFC